jgi:hypothetical protein
MPTMGVMIAAVTEDRLLDAMPPNTNASVTMSVSG